MPCDELGLLLHAHLDGELDAAGAAKVEAHLGGCPDCAVQARRVEELRTAVRTAMPYHRLDPGQRQAIRSALPSSTSRTALPRRPRPWLTTSRRPLVGLAASLLFGIAIGSLWQADGPVSSEPAADDILSAHIRALQLDHAIDVPSSDRHQVKPWFDGKVDFSPPVKDLGEQGFALIGGRLDVVGGKTAAVIVYRRRQHLIDLFVTGPQPGASEGPTSLPSRDGFNLRLWTQDGFRFHAISDLNGDELDEFVDRWRRAG